MQNPDLLQVGLPEPPQASNKGQALKKTRNDRRRWKSREIKSQQSSASSHQEGLTLDETQTAEPLTTDPSIAALGCRRRRPTKWNKTKWKKKKQAREAQQAATTNEQHAIVEVIVSMLANLGIEVEGCEVEDGCEEGGSTQNDELKYFPRPNWDGNIWK